MIQMVRQRIHSLIFRRTEFLAVKRNRATSIFVLLPVIVQMCNCKNIYIDLHIRYLCLDIFHSEYSYFGITYMPISLRSCLIKDKVTFYIAD